MGIPSVSGIYTTSVTLTLTNTSNANRKYDLAASYREEADQASGAVSIKIAPNSVIVPKGKTQKIKVQVEHRRVEARGLAVQLGRLDRRQRVAAERPRVRRLDHGDLRQPRA